MPCRALPAGRSAGYEAKIVDDDMKDVPAGTIGRLAVRGPTGCRYLADQRQKAYVSDGWNLTGDAFLRDENGRFHFAARADDMIVSAGYNIAGPEVEAALLSHPEVAECAVIGATDIERGQIVSAFVVLKQGITGDALRVKSPAGSRESDNRALQISTGSDLRRCAAEDADWQDSALQIAGAKGAMTNNMTNKFEVIQPAGWAAPKGYANGIAAQGRQVFIAGQIGWDAQAQFESDDFVAQVEQALRNVVDVLAAAGGDASHLVRLNWYVTDKSEYVARQREVGDAYRRTIGRYFPAMTLVVVAGLLENRAKVEIEATAVLPAG